MLAGGCKAAVGDLTDITAVRNGLMQWLSQA